jgi:1-acyl-sn-glycerol-3-phosphate acyltransferase
MSILEDPKYSYLIGKQSIFFRFWKKIFYYYCNTVFSLYTPVKINGRENLPLGSAIFCSNHNSHMDVALISSAVGKSFNHFGMLAAIDYWFDSRIKKILTNFVMNLIPIARKTNAKDGSISFQDTIALSKSFMDYGNRNIVIFPEGSRGEPDQIKPFRNGAARFSLALNKPIVPVFIHGSFRAWPRGKVFMRPCRITINILEPMYPNDYISKDKADDLIAKEITGHLEKIILDERESYASR